MRFRPFSLTKFSAVQQDGGVGADVLYDSLKVVIPSDGFWRVDGYAGLSSQSVADTKRLVLAANGVFMGDSTGPAADGALGSTLGFVASYTGWLKKGTTMQLLGQRNGGSILRVGNSSTNVVFQRITVTRLA